MQYAIIEFAGKQHTVSVGDTLTVDRQDSEALKDKTLVIENVLLVKDDKKTEVGTPFVKGAKVTLEHVEDQRGEKLRIFNYKAKSRVRKTQGYRSAESVFVVKSITG